MRGRSGSRSGWCWSLVHLGLEVVAVVVAVGRDDESRRGSGRERGR